MPDMVASIFKLENDRRYSAPKVAIQYMEQDTGTQWTINGGGMRRDGAPNPLTSLAV